MLDRTVTSDSLTGEQRALMPNLFLVGAGKCGTTSLHSYLSDHPAIMGAREKEPSYFCKHSELQKHQLMESMRPEATDLDAYLALFEGGQHSTYRLESSPTYASYPEFTGVPERIAAASPDAMILFLVRNPVDRAISHYWQDRKILKETKPLDEAMHPETLYVWSSQYKMQIDRFREVFGPDRIRIMASEDLRERPNEVLAGIFEWLDLPPHSIDVDAMGEKNKTADVTRQARLSLFRRLRDTRAWNLLRSRLPRGVLDAVRKLAVKEAPRIAEGEEAVRARLRAMFEPEVAELDAAYGTRMHARWFG